MSDFELPEELDDALEVLEFRADPENCVTLSFSTGRNFVIELESPTSLGEVLDRADLIISQGTQFFVEGTEVGRDFEVAPGATIQAVGAAKGG